MSWNMFVEPADDRAIESLLLRIPERWGEYIEDDFTAAETHALKSLVAVGLVELQVQCLYSCVGRQEIFECCFRGFGDAAFKTALEPVREALFEKWGDTQGWQCEVTKRQWRLTTNGVEARDALAAPCDSDLQRWVRSRVFDRAKSLDGFLHRHPNFGDAHILRQSWIVSSDSPLPVNVNNSKQLAEDIAMAIGRGLLQSPQQSVTIPVSAKNAAPKGTSGRKPDETKQRHANRADELRSQTPQPTWKDVAAAVNAEFELDDESKYKGETIRQLHRNYFEKKSIEKSGTITGD